MHISSVCKQVVTAGIPQHAACRMPNAKEHLKIYNINSFKIIYYNFSAIWLKCLHSFLAFPRMNFVSDCQWSRKITLTNAFTHMHMHSCEIQILDHVTVFTAKIFIKYLILVGKWFHCLVFMYVMLFIAPLLNIPLLQVYTYLCYFTSICNVRHEPAGVSI